MDKLRTGSVDITKHNIEKLGALFPQVVTEMRDEHGNLKKGINFDLLKQELSSELVDREERYEFTWVGKKQSIIEANTPIHNTLRPCIEESKDWENTENLYIEGDNLEVLKLLQESYLNKVKMIYIDPPYNTGNDFIYRDNFKMDKDVYEEQIEFRDDKGNINFKQNNDSNPRFHSDWCSMIYPRLKLAYNLLSDDGVIFISIDDNEVDNLKKICDEVFGEGNFVGDLIRKTKSITNDIKSGLNLQHEYCLIYAKSISYLKLISDEKDFSNYANPDNDPKGDWFSDNPSARSGGPGTYFEITNPYTSKVDYPPTGRYWGFSKESFKKYVESGKIKFKKDHKENERGFIFKRYKIEIKNIFNPVDSLVFSENNFMNQAATKELNNLFDESYFSYPKPVSFIYQIIKYGTIKDSIILDFFSGSSTTAHAVMQLNAEDGGNRKFIMVQLDEPCDEQSEAYKAGYKNICEIGKERIRRAGEKVKADHKDKEYIQSLDTGFRVLKLDSSNMKDVKYPANEYHQDMLAGLESNIKEGRTELDLLYGVLLDWALPLSLQHHMEDIDGVTIHIIDVDSLIACFAERVSEKVIREIASRKPMKVVFRDSSFASSPDKINVTEIFKSESPRTEIKVL